MDDSTTSETYLNRKFNELGTSRAIVIEDDGRVAYAYLLVEDTIVGDVWLYNVTKAPTDRVWRNQPSRPYLNPEEFCVTVNHVRLSETSMVECVWFPHHACVMVDGILWAVLWEGSKPGRSRLAKIRGPLALPIGDFSMEHAVSGER